MTIYSKGDLSELEYLLRRHIPTSRFIFLHDKNGFDYYTIDKTYLNKFVNITAGWINKSFCRKRTEEVLNKRYSTLSPEERIEISCSLIDKLNTEKRTLIKLIKCGLSNLYEIESVINIDGYIRFSLREYKDELDFLIDEYVDDYLIKRDYKEFLALLKYFVNTEEERFEKILVSAQKDGSYRFFNKERIEITDQCITVFKNEFPDEYEEYDDLLISVLIILLPKQIFLYGSKYVKNKRFLKTLKDVFSNRIKIYKESCEFLR